MRIEDLFRFCIQAGVGNRGRTALMLLAMAIGVASVVTLISLGESARAYVTDQFASMGSNLLIVLPGRSETVGGPPPLLGITPRDLTLEDAVAISHSPLIRRMSPVVVGAAPLSWRGREREVTVLGSNRAMFAMRRLEVSQGGILPESDLGRAEALCVIGHRAKAELFGNDSALGRKVRIGDRHLRVIGVLREKAKSLGDELADVVIIPIATAQQLFNTASLFRIVVEADSEEAIPRARAMIVDTIRQRHDGEDDITVITQDAILATFNKIFKALTMSVAGIAAISLLVAGIIIMNVMLVAISNRRSEIGLLKALGASRGQILRLFLTEAALLSVVGAFCGLALGLGAIGLLAWSFPGYSITVARWASPLAVAVALLTGLVFGVLPARRAAGLPAAHALSRR